MIKTLEGFPPDTVAIEAFGEVSTDDYDDVLVPAIAGAHEHAEKINMLYVLGHHFEQYTAGAIWADTKVGAQHPLGWRRVAVVTDIAWIGHAMALANVMTPAKVKSFPVSELDDAKAWVVAGD